MFENFPLFPDQASTIAHKVDNYYFFMIAVSVFFTVAICGVLLFFAVKFRRRPEAEEPKISHEGFWFLEVIWIAVPLGIVTVMFFWATMIFYEQTRQPKNAMEILVVGKQWMWKIQHLNGRREINELHVPVGTTVKLNMATQDVLHSFYIPAFRVKQDVVPGRLTTMHFTPTKPGKYHLFCAEYCGTNHSRMTGSVYVMEKSEFQDWLAGTAGVTSPAEAGKLAFEKQACITCHAPGSGARGPNLAGIFGKKVRLMGGQEVVADENYIRESILTPHAKIVEGYQPIMPTFKGLVNEEQLLQLIAYIKSMEDTSGGAGNSPTTQAATPEGQLAPHVSRETMTQPNQPPAQQPQPAEQSAPAPAAATPASAAPATASPQAATEQSAPQASATPRAPQTDQGSATIQQAGVTTSPGNAGTTAPAQESQ
jgi:cytochrome c oxidase subunit II